MLGTAVVVAHSTQLRPSQMRRHVVRGARQRPAKVPRLGVIPEQHQGHAGHVPDVFHCRLIGFCHSQVKRTRRRHGTKILSRVRGCGYFAGAAAPTVRMKVILISLAGMLGRSLSSRITWEILVTTGCPSTTCPKIAYLPSPSAYLSSVMKNWQSAVPGPLLAMARRPARSNLRLGTNSSGSLNPQL